VKTYLGHGAYLEPDDGPRDSPWHKRIVRTERIPGTRVGNVADLACGHRVMMFGDPAHTGGVVLCVVCRDAQNP
jgi:hypothetical protein